MSTLAQKALKQHIGSLKWADEMFLSADTADDVDMVALAQETLRVLEARRADVLCSEKDQDGNRCTLSKAHRGQTPHSFEVSRSEEPLKE